MSSRPRLISEDFSSALRWKSEKNSGCIGAVLRQKAILSSLCTAALPVFVPMPCVVEADQLRPSVLSPGFGLYKQTSSDPHCPICPAALVM